MCNHLSVDLDYFNNSKIGVSSSFWKKIKRSKKPIWIFYEHQDIIPFINKTKYEKIINIDWHDDIVESDDLFLLEDYNWANYYKYQKNSIYEWRYPFKKNFTEIGIWREGRCTDVDVWKYNLTEWKKIKHGEGIRGINFNDVKDISVVLSNRYTQGFYVKEILMELFGDDYLPNIMSFWRSRKWKPFQLLSEK